MDADRMAALLLIGMPFSFAMKTIAVAVTVGVLAGQDPVDRLGRIIFGFFIALMLTSAGLTGLFGALAIAFHDARSLGEWLMWLGIVELASTATAILGLWMVLEHRGMDE